MSTTITYTALVLCGMFAMATAACRSFDSITKDDNCEHPDFPDLKLQDGGSYVNTADCLQYDCYKGTISECTIELGCDGSTL